MLVEFNRSFNEGVANVNWAMTANFHAPESFRKAQALAGQEEKRVKKLEGRLRFLRIVCDSTLFVLSMFETFFWLELVACILIFAVLPLFLYYGDRFGLEFAVKAFKQERWQIQKALLILVSALSLGIASLRTILRFESIREKILTKAKAGVIKPGAVKPGKKETTQCKICPKSVRSYRLSSPASIRDALSMKPWAPYSHNHCRI